MISKKQEKLIRSLRQKKYRKEHQLFLVEGEKLVEEAIQSDFEIAQIFCVSGMEPSAKTSVAITEISDRSMKAISNLSTPPGILALVRQKEGSLPQRPDLVLALENVRDPGNLGTIIRSADAFGVKLIVCSPETTDAYSPKVVQASMGSIFHIPFVYKDLSQFFQEQLKAHTLYGLHLEGENLYQCELKKPTCLVMGNESSGLSKRLEQVVDSNLKIPIAGEAESLNVSMATTVVLAEFRRRLSWQ
ncbi:MAG: RNA methyltransferase [Vicingaceae bacterium]